MTKVLVVDDERKMRRVLQILLERMGIDSVGAESGEEAFERFQAEKFDLVLTDLKMPGMTGLELLARVREVDAEVPVMLLTAYGTIQTAVDAMTLAACAYVRKAPSRAPRPVAPASSSSPTAARSSSTRSAIWRIRCRRSSSASCRRGSSSASAATSKSRSTSGCCRRPIAI